VKVKKGEKIADDICNGRQKVGVARKGSRGQEGRETIEDKARKGKN